LAGDREGAPERIDLSVQRQWVTHIDNTWWGVESTEQFGEQFGLPLGIFFYSAFFTSVWLWLYAASVLVSRVLLRMNSGVGFLLRVTDVERQPFRSMGFVSIILVSGLFALGLPLVVL